MAETALTARPAHELAALLRSGALSSRELTEAALARMEAVEPQVGAFLTPTPELALETARAVDDARARGEQLPPLAGIPIAVKDNICVREVRCTCASRILEDYVAVYDATVTDRLRQARMPILGKANLDEFAMGSSTENSAFGPTRNPLDLARVPGGSSGGSAAAVGAGIAPLALGSDTGGSIRQPAAYCGITGLKPTYGRVSRYGLVAFASSLDQIGPLAHDVRDAALALEAIAGHDPRDSTSADLPVPAFSEALTGEVRGLRVGIIEEFTGEGITPAVGAAVEAATEVLVGLGATLGRVSLPSAVHAVPVYYVVAPAEASSNLARFDGVRYGHRTERKVADPVEMYARTRAEGFGAEVKRRILTGTYALAAGYYDAYYLKAQQVRTLLCREFARAFEQFDVLVCPTAPDVAFRMGEHASDPIAMYLADICTIPVNLAGLPGISVPCGVAPESGMPVGLQFITRAFDEQTLLRAADAYQQATEWHLRRASL